MMNEKSFRSPALRAVAVRCGSFIVPHLHLHPPQVRCHSFFARRLWRRENVLRPHRSHPYQRLTARGYSHPIVTALYLVLSVMMGGLALIYRQG